MRNVITFGSFDVFHVGHLRLLQRASTLGDKLFVGVSTDQLHRHKKSRDAIYSFQDRVDILTGLSCVSKCFAEESLKLKRTYITKYQANILVMGDDWMGAFDNCSDLCRVVYLERTPSISTSKIIEVINSPS